jgi:predicted metal-dependent phosphoesterase TrpH
VTKQPYADLHVHTNHSDGTDTPARVVERATGLGIAALAIADHDTVSGVAEAREAAEEHGIAFLPAVEISSHFNSAEIHIVGLGIDPEDEALLQGLAALRESRTARAARIVERLHTLGVPVDPERIAARTDGVIGRIHIAQEIHDLGYADTVQDAFDRYIGKGQQAFVHKHTVSCGDAIALIHGAGGLAFLAHPGIGSAGKMLDRLLRLPFDGIEAYHCKHNPGQTEAFLRIAEERDLLVAGGSDCHGQAKRKPEMGNVRVPLAHYQKLQETLAGRQ